MTSFSVDLRDCAPRAGLTCVMQALAAAGLNQGAAGNASVRTERGYFITPSGVAPQQLADNRHLELTLDDDAADARGASSEWRFHRDIYRVRPEIGAIVHVHSPFATALACLRREIPSFHYMIGIGGGDSIRCADYATFGTQALADSVLHALAGRRACLLANHGLIATGKNLAVAFDLTLAVEDLAHQFCITLQCGEPVLLSPAQMREVMERFKTYGQAD